MERYFYTLLHLFYPAGIESLRINQTQSVSHVQPYYRAGISPAKENSQMKHLILTVWIVLTALALAACGLGNTRLSSAEGSAYAAEVDEYVENMLAGRSECDFARYTRGFDLDEWEGTLDESAWQQECEAGFETGAYRSKTLDYVEDRQDFRVVIYHVVFENIQEATLSVYFYIDDPDHLIIGYEIND